MSEGPRGSIVFLNNFPGPGKGGGEVVLMHVARGMLAAEWDVTIVCPPDTALGDAGVAAGARVVQMPMSGRAAGRIVSVVREEAASADVLVGTGYFTNMLVRRAARRLPACVVNLIQVDPLASVADGGSRLDLTARRFVDRVTRRGVDAFIAVSHSIANTLADEGVPQRRVHVVHNGVDVSALRTASLGPLPPGMPPGDGPLIGCVARLEPVKGVDDFLIAAIALASAHPAARFVVAGSGTQEKMLRAMVPADLADRVVLLGDVRPVAPLMARLDALVLPSRSEGLGVAPLEAMVFRVPVVVTAVGGMPEVVSHGVTGLLTAPGDPASLADAIGALIADPFHARAMGEAGRKRVESEFTLERMVAGHRAVYEELLAR